SSDPRPAPKPQPLGNIPFILLFTTTAVCILFVLWRRAHTFRAVISHQLKTWTRREGAIRLSQDEGPTAESFLEDEVIDDNEELLDVAHLRSGLDRPSRRDEDAEGYTSDPGPPP
ncbi:hypothetical protein OF83DRAFT_1018951, partial [Amylostereum chailletii]